MNKIITGYVSRRSEGISDPQSPKTLGSQIPADPILIRLLTGLAKRKLIALRTS
jgi:hypothetical protein